MFTKLKFSILLFSVVSAASMHSAIAQNSISDQYQYISFLSRTQELPEQIRSHMASTVSSYKGAQAGVDVHCFWTKDRQQIDAFMAANRESAKNPGQVLQYSYEVKWGIEYTLPSFSEKMFERGFIAKRPQNSLTLNRACVSVYIDHAETERKIRSEAITSFAKAEKAEALISLLAILERDPSGQSGHIREVNQQLKAIISSMEASNEISSAARDAFFRNFSGSVELDPQKRSELAFQILMESLVERETFVPKHRHGTFLAQLFATHRHLIGVSPEAPVIWMRNQIWPRAQRANFLIDFHVTSKQELCENYFAYSLPIFLRSLKNEAERGELAIVGHPAETISSLASFTNEVVPDLLKTCRFKKSIQFLEKEVYELKNQLNRQNAPRISEESAIQKEWALYFPNKPFMNVNNHSLVELIVNWNPESFGANLDGRRLVKTGEVAFVPMRDLADVRTVLSRFGLLMYQGENTCALGYAPLLGLSRSVGRQFDRFHACIKNTGDDRKNLQMLQYVGTSTTVSRQENRSGYNDGMVEVLFENFETFSQGNRQYLAPDLNPNGRNYLVTKIKIVGGEIDSVPATTPTTADITATRSLRACNVPTGGDANRDYSYCDFRRAPLRDLNLQGYSFEGANLEGADIRGTDFSNANLNQAKLRGAVFRQSEVTRGNNGTKFSERDIGTNVNIRSMVPYNYCNWAYDQFCGQSSQNPFDCLKDEVRQNRRSIPVACASWLGLPTGM